MLMPVLYAMTNIAADRSARSLPAPLVSLPPTFISTLCYLVCETLDRRRQDDVSVTGVLEELCMNLSVFVSQALQTGKEGSGVPFRHLAVLEVAKRGVIALQHRSYDTAVDSRELLGMLCLGDKDMHRWEQRILQLQPSRQAQERQAMHNLLDLLAWRSSAGAIAVLEATMRSAHTPSLVSIIQASDQAARMILEQRFSTDPQAGSAMVSMAATVRKLLHVHSAAHTAPVAAGGRQGVAAFSPLEAPQALDQEGRQWTSSCVATLSTAVVYLDCMMQSEMGNRDAHLRFPGVLSQAVPEDESSSGPPTSALRALLLQRTCTTLLLALLQACALQARAEFQQSPRAIQQPQWYTNMRARLGKLSGDLGPLSQAMMQAPEVWGAASRETISASTYESFTTPSFRIAFLPGCCHLGCSNFEGPSEAALKTLLCSGCRRARYCSGGCQRAAWVQEHRLHCGKV
ncbi:MAG: hypothetical protein WDW38_008852 [Sanguina aurantia]